MDDVLAIANIGVLVANLSLIYFVFRQVRHIYRPIITTKVVSREATVDETPTVLIAGDPYLVVSNVSTNQATNLRIGYEFRLGDRRIARLNKPLRYLNPKEATKEPIPLGEIIGYAILFPFLTPTLVYALLAFSAGIMIYISLDEVLPTAHLYGKEHWVIMGVLAGMLIMAMSIFLIR